MITLDRRISSPRPSSRAGRAIVSALVAALLLAACGADGDDASAADDGAGGAAAGGGSGEEPFRIGTILSGTVDDLQFANGWVDGIRAAQEERPNIETEFVELINDPDQVIAQGSAFGSAGYDLVTVAHGAMADPLVQLAQQFPDTTWCLGTYQPPEDAPDTPDNVCWLDVEFHAAMFMAGALAALVTSSDHIASVNGFAFPALTRQPEAFHLGARCVNPDIEFTQEYIETWTDTGLARAATQSMIAAGADVVLAATDSAVLGMVEAANEASNDVWVVPAYYEQRSIGPDVVLTSAVSGLDVALKDLVVRVMDGDIGPGEFIRSDATDNEGIGAPLYPEVEASLGEEDLTTFRDIEQRVNDGDITVPDEVEGDHPVGEVGSGGRIPLEAIGCA